VRRREDSNSHRAEKGEGKVNIGSTKKETRRSLFISVTLHLAILLLLIFNGGVKQRSVGSKLTEVSFIERYGPEVASRIVRRRIPIRTHRLLKMFSPSSKGGRGDKPAEAKPRSNPSGLRRRSRMIDEGKFASPTRQVEDLIDVDQDVRVSSQPRKRSTIAQGRLVGRKAEVNLRDLPFEVEEDLPKLDSADIEMAVKIPVGGLESGNKHFVGGILTKEEKGLEKPAIPPLASSGDLVDIPDGGGGGGRGTLLNYGEAGSGGGGGNPTGRRGNSEVIIPKAKRLKMLSEEVDAQVVVKSQREEGGNLKSGRGVTMRLSGPLSGREILRSFAPEYPEWATRKGIEGRVDLHLTVNQNGLVKDNVYVERTSGQTGLDRVAIDAVKRWVFAPLPPDVAQIEQWGIITIFFRLE